MKIGDEVIFIQEGVHKKVETIAELKKRSFTLSNGVKFDTKTLKSINGVGFTVFFPSPLMLKHQKEVDAFLDIIESIKKVNLTTATRGNLIKIALLLDAKSDGLEYLKGLDDYATKINEIEL